MLHHLATFNGCIGLFATHYHSLAEEFRIHPEISRKRTAVRRTGDKPDFQYISEDGVAEESFGFDCASSAGISQGIVDTAKTIAKDKARERYGLGRTCTESLSPGNTIPLGIRSDVAMVLNKTYNEHESEKSFDVLKRAVAHLRS